MKVIELLKHPAINKSWVAEQLWGEASPKNRTKISLRLSLNRPWPPEDVAKLQEIFKKLKSEL